MTDAAKKVRLYWQQRLTFIWMKMNYLREVRQADRQVSSWALSSAGDDSDQGSHSHLDEMDNNRIWLTNKSIPQSTVFRLPRIRLDYAIINHLPFIILTAATAIQSGPEKNCTKFNAPSFCSSICSRITCFHQNAQKLTGNTKSGQILNTVIKYSLFDSW